MTTNLKISSYNQIKQFLIGSDAIQQILDCRNQSPEVNPSRSWKSHHWIILTSAILFSFTATVVPVINTLAALVIGASTYTILSKNTTTTDPLPVSSLGASKIITTINEPNEQARALNESKPIRVKDERLKKHLGFKPSRLKFQHDGICMGEVAWFLKLYLKTRDQFSDPRAHMIALGKQFENGGPPESVLLQSVCIRGGKILGVKRGARHQSGWFESWTESDIKIKEIYTQSNNALNHLKNLPVGPYELLFPHHATAFIKVSNDLSYFFDPNEGIYEITSAEQSKTALTLFKDLLECLDLTDVHRIFFTRYKLHS